LQPSLAVQQARPAIVVLLYYASLVESSTDTPPFFGFSEKKGSTPLLRRTGGRSLLGVCQRFVDNLADRLHVDHVRRPLGHVVGPRNYAVPWRNQLSRNIDS